MKNSNITPIDIVLMQYIRIFFKRLEGISAREKNLMFRKEEKILSKIQRRKLTILDSEEAEILEGKKKTDQNLSIDESYNLSLHSNEVVHASQEFTLMQGWTKRIPTFYLGKILYCSENARPNSFLVEEYV